MPRYLVTEAPKLRTASEEEPHRPVPLREQVSECLRDWDVDSSSSEDGDDFCGWRVGSRSLATRSPRVTICDDRRSTSSFPDRFSRRPTPGFGGTAPVTTADASSQLPAWSGWYVQQLSNAQGSDPNHAGLAIRREMQRLGLGASPALGAQHRRQERPREREGRASTVARQREHEAAVRQRVAAEVGARLPSRPLAVAAVDRLSTCTWSAEHSVRECSICTRDYEPGDTLVVLPCSVQHCFHAHCVTGWLRQKGTCPLCRRRPDAHNSIASD